MRRYILAFALPILMFLGGWFLLPAYAEPASSSLAAPAFSLPSTFVDSKSVLWLRVDANITVHEDGTFTVEEILQVHFIGDIFTYGYRDIPLDRVTDITDVQLWDAKGAYARANTEADHTFTLTRDDEHLHIRWYFDPVEDETRTFHLAYRVHGGLRAYPDGDQLWWKAVFPDREGAVILSTVTVTVPGPVQAYAAYFVTADAEQLDARTVRFRAQHPIPAGVPFEVRVQWPHGVIPVTPAAWQVQADREVRRTEWLSLWYTRGVPLAEVGLLFGGIGLAVIGLLTLLVLWFVKGRERPVPRIAYLPEPPSDLPPALAGLLVDMDMKPRHILATLVDFARRGVLTIEERTRPTAKRQGLARYLPLPKPERDIRFHLTHGFPRDLPRFERRILRGVMGRSEHRRLRDLRGRFYKHVPKIRQAMEEDLIDRGLFPYRPSEKRKVYERAGKVLIGLSFLLLLPVAFEVVKRMGIDDRLALVPLGAMLLLGGVTLVTARFMTRRTPQGAEEAERWRAFRRYLQNLHLLAESPPAQETLERYLPYAIAFGVEKAFLDAWEAVLGEQTSTWPAWYHPAFGTHSGGNLSSTSEGVGTSLAALSAGLGAMLADASSALAASSRSASGGGGFG